MSQKEANDVNKVFHVIVSVFSIALAIVALVYNPAHIFSAAIIFSFGINAEIVKADDIDLRY